MKGDGPWKPGEPVTCRPADSLGDVISSWPLTCPSCHASLELKFHPGSAVTSGEAATSGGAMAPRADGPSPGEASSSRLEALKCSSGHRFDAARQGYVNLLAGRGTRFTPDSAQMIMARERVQDAGVFRALSTELERIRGQLPAHRLQDSADPPLLLDCGAGTGHYLHQLLEADGPAGSAGSARGIALDLSTAGLKRAARHRRTLALAWDLWRPLPLESASVDLVLDVFAPRHVTEYARVLRPGGLAVVVTPRDGHLAELRAAGMLGVQGQKLRQLQEQMAPSFGVVESITRVTSRVPVDPGLAADLVFMGPAGHHSELETLRRRLQAADVAAVTVDLDVSLWRR